MVKLHHPLTGKQIGEVVRAHCITLNIITFEMVRGGGQKLRVLSNGIVGFIFCILCLLLFFLFAL
jgi:hypothetical protein